MIDFDIPDEYFETLARMAEVAGGGGYTPCYTIPVKYRTNPPEPVLSFFWKVDPAVTDWCKSECSDWSLSAYYKRVDETPNQGRALLPQVRISFANEIDAVKFRLRWH